MYKAAAMFDKNRAAQRIAAKELHAIFCVEALGRRPINPEIIKTGQVSEFTDADGIEQPLTRI
jgi:hypothetical protein